MELSAYDNRILTIIQYRGIVTRHRLEATVPDIDQRSLDRSLRRLEEYELISRWVTKDHGAIYVPSEVAASIRANDLESKILEIPAKKPTDPRPEPCGFCKQPIVTLDDALDHVRLHYLEMFYLGTVSFVQAVATVLANLTVDGT